MMRVKNERHNMLYIPGRPAGACYVELESQEDLDSALEMNKKNMGKRYIEVSIGCPVYSVRNKVDSIY